MWYINDDDDEEDKDCVKEDNNIGDHDDDHMALYDVITIDRKTLVFGFGFEFGFLVVFVFVFLVVFVFVFVFGFDNPFYRVSVSCRKGQFPDSCVCI